jgi:hypothetical protein
VGGYDAGRATWLTYPDELAWAQGIVRDVIAEGFMIDECSGDTDTLDDNDPVNILDTDPGDNIIAGSGLLWAGDNSWTAGFVNEVFVFMIEKAVDVPGEDNWETNDSLPEVDGVGEEWCLRFSDKILSSTIPILSSIWDSWCAMGFGGDTAEVASGVFRVSLEVPKRTMSVLGWLSWCQGYSTFIPLLQISSFSSSLSWAQKLIKKRSILVLWRFYGQWGSYLL